MDNIWEIVGSVAFITAFGANAVTWFLNWQTLGFIREELPGLYDKLGQPRSPLQTSSMYTKFLYSGPPMELDGTLGAKHIRLMQNLWLFVILPAFILIVISMFYGSRAF